MGEKDRALIEELVKAMGDLIERHDAVVESKEYQSVWTLHFVRCGPYRGPNYIAEIVAARSLLSRAKEAGYG